MSIKIWFKKQLEKLVGLLAQLSQEPPQDLRFEEIDNQYIRVADTNLIIDGKVIAGVRSIASSYKSDGVASGTLNQLVLGKMRFYPGFKANEMAIIASNENGTTTMMQVKNFEVIETAFHVLDDDIVFEQEVTWIGEWRKPLGD